MHGMVIKRGCFTKSVNSGLIYCISNIRSDPYNEEIDWYRETSQDDF